MWYCFRWFRNDLFHRYITLSRYRFRRIFDSSKGYRVVRNDFSIILASSDEYCILALSLPAEKESCIIRLSHFTKRIIVMQFPSSMMVKLYKFATTAKKGMESVVISFPS